MKARMLLYHFISYQITLSHNDIIAEHKQMQMLWCNKMSQLRTLFVISFKSLCFNMKLCNTVGI